MRLLVNRTWILCIENLSIKSFVEMYKCVYPQGRGEIHRGIRADRQTGGAKQLLLIDVWSVRWEEQPDRPGRKLFREKVKHVSKKLDFSRIKP